MIGLATLLAAVGLMASPGPAAAGAGRPCAAGDFQGRHVSIRDEGGAGAAVVLIPGLSTPRALWDAYLPDLRFGHHVLTVQINGFAGDQPRANLRPGMLAGAADEIGSHIARGCVGPAAVVGHALGGRVGILLAARHPGSVRRLLLVDALPFGNRRGGDAAAGDAARTTASRAAAAASAGPRSLDDASADRAAEGLAVKAEARARIRRWLTAADADVVRRAAAEDGATDLRDALARLGVPVTLLYRSADYGSYHDAYAGLPSSSHLIVAEAGHFLMLDQPLAFAAALKIFVE